MNHSPLHNLPLKELHAALTAAEADATSAKERKDAIKAELTRRFEDEFKAAFARDNKLSGDMTIERDGFKIVGAIKKDVKWDSDQLMSVASEMPFDKVRQFFKITFSVPEALFKTLLLADAPLAKKIEGARTTKFSDLAVDFKPAK